MPLKIKDMKIDGYERVVHATNENTELNCFIAIHNIKLGPALGGTRSWEYNNQESQLIDVQRLSEAMTLKNSVCGINFGGGKAALNLKGIKKTSDWLNLLKKLGVNTIKIASMDTNNHEILKAAARTRVPLIVSTGMSTISEITSAVKTLTKENATFCLLHCVSSYPTSVCDANLATISYFNKIFDVPVGYSDHTMGIDACITSIPLGSCIIEKHFTLNKKMDGPDHKLSADPKELVKLVKKIRITEKLLGKPRKQILKSEQKFRITMKRSVGFNQDLRKGTKIKQSMLTFYRPGDGIPPNTINNIIGRKLKQNVTKGTFVNWNMFQPVP